MPESYRALFYIVLLCAATFWLANAVLSKDFQKKSLHNFQLLWLGVLITAVIIGNFWVFSVLSIFILIFFIPATSKNRVYLYLSVAFVLPLTYMEIPGFGDIRYLFNFDYSRLLLIFLLGPLLVFAKQPTKVFSIPSDKYIVFFVLITSLLSFRDNTLTDGLRTVFLNFIDICIPYFVISRLIETQEDMKKALTILFLGIAPFALIGIFESARHWFLYSSIRYSLYGFGNTFNIYSDIRGGEIRASAPFSSPIVLGYVLVVGAGLLFYIKSYIKTKVLANVAMLAIIGALLATKARGPWVGFSILILCHLAMMKRGFRKILVLCFLCLLSLPILNMTETGTKYINMLPIIGDTRSDTIDYRTRLIENAWIVFKRHPIVGSTNYLETPEMENMRQGQGIIDLVNTYIQVALPYGFVGLFLFIAIFFSLLLQSYKQLKKLRPNEIELAQQGRALQAILVSVIFMIGTVSFIDYIPILYWTLVGLMAAHLNILKQRQLSVSL